MYVYMYKLYLLYIYIYAIYIYIQALYIIYMYVYIYIHEIIETCNPVCIWPNIAVDISLGEDLAYERPSFNRIDLPCRNLKWLALKDINFRISIHRLASRCIALICSKVLNVFLGEMVAGNGKSPLNGVL